MDGSYVQLDKVTENKIREMFPVHLSDNDLEWSADWLLMVGIGLVHTALEKHPEYTLGDLIKLTFNDFH